jgi:hypothetical protein
LHEYYEGISKIIPDNDTMSLEISFEKLKVKVTGYKDKVQEGERKTNYWIVFKREDGDDPFMMRDFF